MKVLLSIGSNYSNFVGVTKLILTGIYKLIYNINTYELVDPKRLILL